MAVESLDHTADAGLRITAPTLSELYAEAARGLLGMLVADPAAVREGGAARSQATLTLTAPDREALLVDWLEELLYRFAVDRFVAGRTEVTVAAAGSSEQDGGEGRWELTARLFGEPFDPDRHGRRQEVKAVTYHELCVEPTAEGWRARVIFDI